MICAQKMIFFIILLANIAMLENNIILTTLQGRGRSAHIWDPSGETGGAAPRHSPGGGAARLRRLQRMDLLGQVS